MIFDFDYKLLSKYSITCRDLAVMVALLYSPNGIKISGFDRLTINGIIEYNEDGDTAFITEYGCKLLDSLSKSVHAAQFNKAEMDEFIEKLRSIFPSGKKDGTNKYWRDNSEAIAKKLRNFMKRNPKYSPDEILKATERYVESFHVNYSLMRILPYFIEKEGNSELLTFLEVDTSTGGEYMNIQQMI